MCPDRAALSLEESVKVLAENISDGVLVFQDDRVVLANEAMARMHGCGSPSELIGCDLGNCMLDKPKFRGVNRDSMLGHNNGKAFRWRCMGKGSREYYIEGHPNKILWKGRPAVLSIVFDLTEAAKQETALRHEADTLRKEVRQLRTRLLKQGNCYDLIGKSRAMEALYDMIARASMTDINVLISGESGSGKELVAKTIHRLSHRSSHDFVAVNCTAVHEQLFESELFGHKRGAFTGAYNDRIGYFDAAKGGTLFLDEIGDLDVNAQTKLLRVIDNGEYMPVGDSVAKKSKARIIMATNRNLIRLVEEGKMREDFFYRIYILVINVPPLREHREDIPRIIKHLLKRAGHGKNNYSIPKHVMEKFLQYHWPGNVRELQNVLLRYITTGRLDFVHPQKSPGGGLQEEQSEAALPPKDPGAEGVMLKDELEKTEKDLIRRALDRTGGNKSKAARMLGVPRRTFLRRIQCYELA